MDFLYYNVIQIFLDSNGQIREKVIKRTRNKTEAETFIDLAKELKPQDKVYMVETLED